MEEMLKNQSATPEDRFALAQMYLAAGDWIKASAEFRSLVTTSEKEPDRYLIAYITALLQHGETSSAENYLDRLEKLVPKQFLIVSLRADLLLAKKEPQKALALLNEFIDRTDVQPEDRGDRSRLVAEKLFQLVPEAHREGAETAGRRVRPPGGNALPGIHQAEPRARTALGGRSLGRWAKSTRPWICSNRSWSRATPKTSPAPAPLIWQGGSKFSAEQVRAPGRHRAEGLRRNSTGPSRCCWCWPNSAAARPAMPTPRPSTARSSRRSSGDAVAMNNLAVLLALQGIKLDEALRLMNQAVEIAGRVAAMLDSRASVYMALNDPDNALNDIRAALADGETPVRLFHLAQVYQLSGQEKEARETMDKALQEGPYPRHAPAAGTARLRETAAIAAVAAIAARCCVLYCRPRTWLPWTVLTPSVPMPSNRSMRRRQRAEVIVHADQVVGDDVQPVAGHQLVIGLRLAAAGDGFPVDGQDLLRAEPPGAGRATHIVWLVRLENC